MSSYSSSDEHNDYEALEDEEWSPTSFAYTEDTSDPHDHHNNAGSSKYWAYGALRRNWKVLAFALVLCVVALLIWMYGGG